MLRTASYRASARHLYLSALVTPRLSLMSHQRFYSATDFGGKKDSGFSIMNFVIVALVGTGIFGVVVHKVDDQDASKSMLKKKSSYSEQEWEQYMNSIKRKVLLFKPSTEIYLVPTVSSTKQIQNFTNKLNSISSETDSVRVVNLNDVIKDEMENHLDRYGTLLKTHLIEENTNTNTAGLQYKFQTQLASGIFTKLMRLRLEEIKNKTANVEQQADNFKYVLVNFPNNIQEAIKFESDVAVARKLVLFDDTKNDISDYFETVKKVVRAKKLDDKTMRSLAEEVSSSS